MTFDELQDVVGGVAEAVDEHLEKVFGGFTSRMDALKQRVDVIEHQLGITPPESEKAAASLQSALRAELQRAER